MKSWNGSGYGFKLTPNPKFYSDCAQIMQLFDEKCAGSFLSDQT